ncbi:dihydrofolate reductase family protein [Microterricola viridarii]|uniref:Dihydrofolate reductase n=1 Tax=Microterricola viridarii TaxID=412690 RepID=A0A1H1PM62_9MICO|nr:dihydrofolate reductase family protein [Microterricola viridarii]SDS12256.1 Dihydrofolate reductase [Microterricola viridarii]
MATLIYQSFCSLDGFTADAHGNLDYSDPDVEVSRFVNESLRPIRSYLFGRRMYEAMRVWDSAETLAELPDYQQEYVAIWQAADKTVYSRTLTEPVGPRTRVERSFEVPAIRELKETSPHDILVGGATLAGYALRAGLVDEIRMLVAPALLGGGLRMFPDSVHGSLELIDERRFDGGVVYVAYAVTR